MATYIIMLRFTDKGAAAIKKSTSRAALFSRQAGRHGIKVEAQYWTVGACDGLLILRGEAEAVFRCLAELNAAGNVRTETLPAFDAAEFQHITVG